MAEIERIRPNVVRAREGKATASMYWSSRRVVLVADDGSFADALTALTALRDEVC